MNGRLGWILLVVVGMLCIAGTVGSSSSLSANRYVSTGTVGPVMVPGGMQIGEQIPSPGSVVSLGNASENTGLLPDTRTLVPEKKSMGVVSNVPTSSGIQGAPGSVDSRYFNEGTPLTPAYANQAATGYSLATGSTETVKKPSPSGKSPAPVTSGGQLLRAEAERELAAMTSSTYSHTTYVDEKKGIYNYDCSGFLGYALKRAVPSSFTALGITRPVASDFYDHIVGSSTVPDSGGWTRVGTPLELRPGDIVAWLKPDSSDSTSTGHVMIVAGTPVANTKRPGEVLIPVIDSALSGHAGDTRTNGQTGLGKGTIGIMTDSTGLPTGYYWRGGESTLLQKTEIAFGRIA